MMLQIGWSLRAYNYAICRRNNITKIFLEPRPCTQFYNTVAIIILCRLRRAPRAVIINVIDSITSMRDAHRSYFRALLNIPCTKCSTRRAENEYNRRFIEIVSELLRKLANCGSRWRINYEESKIGIQSLKQHQWHVHSLYNTATVTRNREVELVIANSA